MNTRCWNGFGLAIAMIALMCQSAAANDGRPSRDTLADMGLGGLVVMSDEDAMAVRGMGYKGGGSSVRVWGNSFATMNTKGGSAHSENGYALEGKHFAAGGNYSFAGAEFKSSNGKGGHDSKPSYGGMGGSRGGHTTIKSVKVFAGGSSWGKAY